MKHVNLLFYPFSESIHDNTTLRLVFLRLMRIVFIWIGLDQFSIGLCCVQLKYEL